MTEAELIEQLQLIEQLRSNTPNMVECHTAMESAADRIAELSKVNEYLHKHCDAVVEVARDNMQEIIRLQSKLEAAEAKLAKATETLKFYADVHNYDEGIVGKTYEAPMWAESDITQFEWDIGDAARNMLIELEKTK